MKVLAGEGFSLSLTLDGVVATGLSKPEQRIIEMRYIQQQEEHGEVGNPWISTLLHFQEIYGGEIIDFGDRD